MRSLLALLFAVPLLLGAPALVDAAGKLTEQVLETASQLLERDVGVQQVSLSSLEAHLALLECRTAQRSGLLGADGFPDPFEGRGALRAGAGRPQDAGTEHQTGA